MIERFVARAMASPVVTVVVALALAALAGAVGRSLRFDALPDVTTNQVVVLTRAPGLTPEELERLVTRRIEVAIGGLPGLVRVRSITRYGISSVTAIFDDGTEPFRARQLVKERLDTVAGDLPDGVETPELGPYTGGLGEIYHFTIVSPSRTPAELQELVDVRIAPLLRTVPGVVEVNNWGGARRTLDVVADPMRMAQRHVALPELRDALALTIGNAPGASVPSGPGQSLLRAVAWPRAPRELAAEVVSRDEHTGMPVRVGDVAEVVEGQLVPIGTSTVDGRGETLYVMVQMARGDNALRVLDGIHARMADVRAVLPPDVRVDPIYDRSVLVRATLATVAKNLVEGGALVIAVLFVLLGSLRAGSLVALTIPLSMLGAAAGMTLLGEPGNLMSLGALDFGLVVDGAVVVVEALFHHATSHPTTDVAEFRTRAIDVVRSQVRPVMYSVAIIALVYVPVLTLEGSTGKMFRPMAITVVLAIGTALLLTLTLIPAGARLILRPRDVPTREPLLVRLASRGYEPALDAAMRRPAIVVGVALASLVVAGVLFWRTGTELVPQLDEGDLVVQTTRASDVSLPTAAREAGRLERALLRDVPEVRHVVSRVGSPAVATDIMGYEQADVFVAVAPHDAWRDGLSRIGLIEDVERAIRRDAPGAAISTTQPIQMRFNELLGGYVSDVVITIFGDDLPTLRRLAEGVARAVRLVPGAADVRISAPPAVDLVEVRPRPLDAARLGLTTADVLDAVRAVRTGVPIATTYDGPIQVPVRLRLAGSATAFTVADVALPVDDGRVVPLERVADVEHVETPAMIEHEDAQRRIVVGFNVRGVDLGTVVGRAESSVRAAVPMPRGYRVVWGGQHEQLRQAKERLAWIVPIVMALIVGLLYWLFRSWRAALLVFLDVPFAAVGGMVALAVRGMPVSMSAAVGFIALSGIAVLNGVVLVARARALEADGMPARDAARDAAKGRMRPVLMTALVASLGFVPTMLATGTGAEVQRPLATVVVGGLVTSTLLTLFVLPVLYARIAGRR